MLGFEKSFFAGKKTPKHESCSRIVVFSRVVNVWLEMLTRARDDVGKSKRWIFFWNSSHEIFRWNVFAFNVVEKYVLSNGIPFSKRIKFLCDELKKSSCYGWQFFRCICHFLVSLFDGGRERRMWNCLVVEIFYPKARCQKWARVSFLNHLYHSSTFYTIEVQGMIWKFFAICGFKL